MNTEKEIALIWKTFCLRRVVELMPDTVPSRREFLIQLSKLGRMLDRPTMKYGPSHILSGKISFKKYKKERGEESQRIGEQARKVKKLGDRYFKDFLRIENPKLTNADYQHWKGGFEHFINKLGANAKEKIKVELEQRGTTSKSPRKFSDGLGKKTDS
jgi:hypothetical protein